MYMCCVINIDTHWRQGPQAGYQQTSMLVLRNLHHSTIFPVEALTMICWTIPLLLVQPAHADTICYNSE